MKDMTQERKALMDKEAFRLYPTFVQDREIFRRGFEYADENPNPELKKQWMDKAIEWLDKEFFINKKEMPFTYNDYIHRFKKHMEDK